MERFIDGVNDVLVSHVLGKGVKQRRVTWDRCEGGSDGMDKYLKPMITGLNHRVQYGLTATKKI